MSLARHQRKLLSPSGPWREPNRANNSRHEGAREILRERSIDQIFARCLPSESSFFNWQQMRGMPSSLLLLEPGVFVRRRPALPSFRILSPSCGFSHCRRWCVPSLVRRLWCRWFILNKLLLPKNTDGARRSQLESAQNGEAEEEQEQEPVEQSAAAQERPLLPLRAARPGGGQSPAFQRGRHTQTPHTTRERRERGSNKICSKASDG